MEYSNIKTVRDNNYFEFSNKDYHFSHRFNKSSGKDVFSRHTHECFEIVLVKKGDFYYHYENSTIHIGANTCVITPPQVYHYYEASNDMDYERYIILLKNKAFQNRINISKVEAVNIKNSLILQSIFDMLDYYITHYKNLAKEDILNDLIQLKLDELATNLQFISYFDTSDFIAHPDTSTPDLLLNAILDYINNNLSKIKHLEDIAKYFSISKNYLFQLFKRQLKITPNQYINQKRIIYAKILIDNGEKLSYVAHKCGYDDYTCFYRNYLKYFKSPPSHNPTQRTKK